jgi:arginyl-tRNA synthetase
VTPNQLSAAIRAGLRAAVADGELRADPPAETRVDEMRVERPRRREHGDWSSGVALRLAGPAGRPPREVAQVLATRLAAVPGIQSVDVAGPGFLNIVLDAAAAGELARAIVEAGREYGRGDAPTGQLIAVRDAERELPDLPDLPDLVDLVDRLGADAVRYSLARRPPGSPLTLDVEALTRRSNDNPVYSVQYAHARLCGIARNAREEGVRRQDGFDASLLRDDADAALLAALGEYPGVVARAAALREPHRVTRYLEELAGCLRRWYVNTRVAPRAGEPVHDVHRTRLWLAEAARTVLANGLDLLGVTAPERM